MENTNPNCFFSVAWFPFKQWFWIFVKIEEWTKFKLNSNRISISNYKLLVILLVRAGTQRVKAQRVHLPARQQRAAQMGQLHRIPIMTSSLAALWPWQKDLMQNWRNADMTREGPGAISTLSRFGRRGKDVHSRYPIFSKWW